MSEVVLVLGAVAFSDFEIPERIVFGGAQRLAIHKLPGGTRIIDDLGRDDRELTWSGVFAGPDATERARQLDILRAQGAVLPLTWDVFFYSVVIASFDAEYRHGWWIPYRLTCTVLSDEAGAPVDAAVSPITQAQSDIGTAAGLVSGTVLDLSAVQTALAAPGATTQNTVAYAEARYMISQAQMLIGNAIAEAEAQLASTIVPPSFADMGSVAPGIAALNDATKSAGQLAALAAALGYVGRTAINLSHVGN